MRGSDPLRLALCCFVPERGHIAPLVRIAREAGRAGFDARCFVALQGSPLVERFGVEAELIEVTRPPDADRLLHDLVNVRRPHRRVIARRAYADGYMVPLQTHLAGRFPELKGRVDDFEPDLVLADSHVLGWLYRRVATDAVHVEHVAAGSHFHCQPEVVQRRGLTAVGPSALADLLPRLFEAVVPRLQRVAARDDWRASVRLRGRLHEARARVTTHPDASIAARVATGLGPLERFQLGDRIRPCGDTTYFGALDPASGAKLEPNLDRWLAQPGPPVALLSLGSMIRPDTPLGALIRRGLLGAGLRVLQVGSAGTAGPSPASAESVRYESFIAQPEVLARPEVRLFVTHGGAGAVQEGVWMSTPMLCIPLVSDQFYNGSVVEAMGVGRCLPPLSMSSQDITRAAHALTEDDGVAARSRERAEQLRSLDGGHRLVHFLERLLPTPSGPLSS